MSAYKKTVRGSVQSHPAVSSFLNCFHFAKRFAICYLPVCKYTYRIHQRSLSQTKARPVWHQLWHLRYREPEYLLANIDEEEKYFLFLDMWLTRKTETWELQERFSPEGKLPRQLRWVEQRMTMDSSLKTSEQHQRRANGPGHPTATIRRWTGWPLSLRACRDYVISTMERCGFQPADINLVLAELHEVSDFTTTEDAQASFVKGMTLPAHLSNVEETTREYKIGDFDYWDGGPDLVG